MKETEMNQKGTGDISWTWIEII